MSEPARDEAAGRPRLEAQPGRVIHEFDVPEAVIKAAGRDVTSIGIHELMPDEELQAVRRAKEAGLGGQIQLAGELAKASIASINGKPVSLADGSTDRTWKRMHPQVRQLVVTAYASVHAPPEGAVEDFLASRRSSG